MFLKSLYQLTFSASFKSVSTINFIDLSLSALISFSKITFIDSPLCNFQERFQDQLYRLWGNFQEHFQDYLFRLIFTLTLKSVSKITSIELLSSLFARFHPQFFKGVKKRCRVKLPVHQCIPVCKVSQCNFFD